MNTYGFLTDTFKRILNLLFVAIMRLYSYNT